MELLAVQPRSAPELAAELGIHVRTARQLLRRLDHDGYAERTGDPRRRYRPTRRSVALAGQVVEHAELTQTAVPHTTEVRDQLGEDCHLCEPSYLSALCLVHAGRHPASGCRPQLRELVPCHCTAAGKALLAWREPWRQAVLAQPLMAFTDRTLTGPQYLDRELAKTVARGYSIEDREHDPHTRGLGAPVLVGDREVVAAIAVVAPVSRLPAERYAEIGEALTRTADALSTDLS